MLQWICCQMKQVYSHLQKAWASEHWVREYHSFPESHSNSHLSNQQTKEQMETAAFGHSGMYVKWSSHTRTSCIMEQIS